MIYIKQLRNLIQRVLVGAELYSPEAEELLMGTAAQESRLGTYLYQVRGPALGIFQMEPATEADIWTNYISYHHDLKLHLRDGGYTNPSPRRLEADIAYQILMARIHYRRVKGQLPAVENVAAQARYWKQFYNTLAGKGTVEEYLKNYKGLVKS